MGLEGATGSAQVPDETDKHKSTNTKERRNPKHSGFPGVRYGPLISGLGVGISDVATMVRQAKSSSGHRPGCLSAIVFESHVGLFGLAHTPGRGDSESACLCPVSLSPSISEWLPQFCCLCQTFVCNRETVRPSVGPQSWSVPCASLVCIAAAPIRHCTVLY